MRKNKNSFSEKSIKDKEIRKANKDYMLRVRMSTEDVKRLNKISKILKVSHSETMRMILKQSEKDLSKQKNIFE